MLNFKSCHRECVARSLCDSFITEIVRNKLALEQLKAEKEQLEAEKEQLEAEKQHLNEENESQARSK